jgi:putative phosphoribosyl transferase
MRFHDRTDAGRQLAERLRGRSFVDPVVLALPRGGVPVGFEVATALGAPLDVFVARKIGAPGQKELGVGAIAEGSDDVVASEVARMLDIDDRRLRQLAERERPELDRRVAQYRDGPLVDVTGRDVIVVDDGLATGVTAEAALRALRQRKPRSLVLAVPVAAPDVAERLKAVADDVVCILFPTDFRAVGLWYDTFSQTSDDEVIALLARAR